MPADVATTFDMCQGLVATGGRIANVDDTFEHAAAQGALKVLLRRDTAD